MIIVAKNLMPWALLPRRIFNSAENEGTVRRNRVCVYSRNQRIVILLAICYTAAMVLARLWFNGSPSENELIFTKLPLNSNRYLLGPEEFKLLSSPNISQDDPGLVALVRKMLIPPSTQPYNFSRKELADPQIDIDPSGGQSQAVKDILVGFGTDGFFLDCGANDGEWYTNTLWVERNLGWSGILIEADPRPFSKLVRKNRKAFLGNFCLSTTRYPQIVPFYINDQDIGIGSGLIYSTAYRATKSIPVQCIPLYTVMLALGRTSIDFMSLDVEGSEIEILRTLPENAILKVVTIEHDVLKEGKLGLRKFMEERGYIFYRTVADPMFVAGDSVFIHKSVQLTKDQLAIVGTDNDTYHRASRN